jgi:hypothetical protein
METLGERLSPILKEIEDTLWEQEVWGTGQPHYTDEGFRSIVKIFMSGMLDKMYTLQKKEDFVIDDMAAMAESLGNQIRSLVKTYCDIDTYELYNEQ